MSGSIRGWKLVGTSALIAVLQLLLVSPAVWGQLEVELRDEGAGVWPWLITLALILVVAGAGFLNSKRTHLD
jgi:hypothetical protein